MLALELADERKYFKPREIIQGIAKWGLNKKIEFIEIRLFWYTKGKGNIDVELAQVVKIEQPPNVGEKDFAFTAPNGPYSFSGKLISLIWAIELITKPATENARVEFFISHTGAEILLVETAIQPEEVYDTSM